MKSLLIKALTTTNTVILPDFGGFMKMGSSYMFNAFLKYNDGKFSKFLQEEQGISEEEANQKIEDFISEILNSINNGDAYELGEIGSLIKEGSNVKLNKPDSVVVKKEIDEQEQEEQQEEQQEEEQEQEQEIETVVETELVTKPEVKEDEQQVEKQEQEDQQEQEKEIETVVETELVTKPEVKEDEQQVEKQEQEDQQELEEEIETVDETEPVVEPEVKEEEQKVDEQEQEQEQEVEEQEGYLAIHFSAKKAVKKMGKMTDKQDLIEFASGDKRKTVIEALNKQLKKLNKTDSEPIEEKVSEEAPIVVPEVEEAKTELEEKDITPEVDEQIKQESDILVTLKEKEQQEQEQEQEQEAETIEETNLEVEEVPLVVPEVKVEQEEQQEQEQEVEKQEQEQEQEQEEEQEEQQEEEDLAALATGADKIESEAKGRKRNKAILWIAIICLLSGGGIVGFLNKDLFMGEETAQTETEKESDQNEKEASKDQDHKNETEEPVEVIEEPEVTPEEMTDEVAEDTEEVIEEVMEDPEVVEEPEPEPVQPVVSSSGNYHIIVGSFSKVANAESLVEELKGEGFSGAGILGTFNGLESVKLGSYSSKDEAKAALAQSGKNGWIKKY